HAFACATLAGATQASMENSPEAVIIEAIFALEAVEACALPPAPMLMPQPPAQVMPLESSRSAAGVTPLVSYAVVPEPVLNSYLATRLASERLPPEATV